METASQFAQKNRLFCSAQVEPQFTLWNLAFCFGNAQHRFKNIFGEQNRVQSVLVEKAAERTGKTVRRPQGK